MGFFQGDYYHYGYKQKKATCLQIRFSQGFCYEFDALWSCLGGWVQLLTGDSPSRLVRPRLRLLDLDIGHNDCSNMPMCFCQIDRVLLSSSPSRCFSGVWGFGMLMEGSLPLSVLWEAVCHRLWNRLSAAGRKALG